MRRLLVVMILLQVMSLVGCGGASSLPPTKELESRQKNEQQAVDDAEREMMKKQGKR